MSQTKFFIAFFKKNEPKIFFSCLFFLVLLYFYTVWKNFNLQLNLMSWTLGSEDLHNNWRGLEEFIHLRVPFKDFYYEYGWLYLAIQSVSYLLFGPTFFSLLISRELVLPILGVVLSIFIAKNILKDKFLVLLFLFFCWLFATSFKYVSLRHIMAEFSLSLFILYFLKKNPRYLIFSGLVAGLAVLASFEYGVALNIALLIIFLLSFFSQEKISGYLTRFLPAQLLVVSPYFLWLFLNRALRNFWDFNYGFIKNFHQTRTCLSGLPRLSELTDPLGSISQPHFWNLMIKFLQRLNFYVVFLTFFLFLAYSLSSFVKKRKFEKKIFIFFSISLYGLLIYWRTLKNPCIIYFIYGLVPFALLLVLLIKELSEKFLKTKKPIFLVLILLIFFWFSLTEYNGYLVKILSGNFKEIGPPRQRMFYPPAGWYLDRQVAKDFKELSDYVSQNTAEDDPLFVYPRGPYNHTTGRPWPTTIIDKCQFIAGEKFIEQTIIELEEEKPKLVILNTYNASKDGFSYDENREGDEEAKIVFVNQEDRVAEYILENYRFVKRNRLGIILIRETD